MRPVSAAELREKRCVGGEMGDVTDQQVRNGGEKGVFT